MQWTWMITGMDIVIMVGMMVLMMRLQTHTMLILHAVPGLKCLTAVT